MGSRKVLSMVALLGIACSAWAGGKPPQETETTVNNGGDAYAGAAAVAGAAAIAGGGDAVATGGAGGAGGEANASAAGGAGGSAEATQNQVANGGEGGAGGDASNLGNTQHIAINHQRSAPSIAQGALMASGCGAGANGGGSRTGGAGFLGFVWTTDQCYALLAAAAYQAIGMPDTSCDLLNSMPAVRKAFKRAGKPLPDCTMAENRDMTSAAERIGLGLAMVEPPAETKCEECATREELSRAFEKSQGK